MKILFKFILERIRNFFINPFWKSIPSLIVIILSLILNALIWYFYVKYYRSLIGIEPIAFSSAVLLLNVFLAAVIYKREILASYVLLSTAVTIQIIFIVFLRFLSLSQTY